MYVESVAEAVYCHSRLELVSEVEVEEPLTEHCHVVRPSGGGVCPEGDVLGLECCSKGLDNRSKGR